MTVMTPLAAAIDQASGSFSGELVQPDDAGYDVWRRVHNGLIDKRPAAIARCQGVADVVDAATRCTALSLEPRGAPMSRRIVRGAADHELVYSDMVITRWRLEVYIQGGDLSFPSRLTGMSMEPAACGSRLGGRPAGPSAS